MCDFSINKASRPARVGDKLIVRDFGNTTRGFSPPDDANLAVCLLPGTELAFAGDVSYYFNGLGFVKSKKVPCSAAIFRQVNKDEPNKHHDALEFPDGSTVLLTLLCVGQKATVLQLGVDPRLAHTEFGTETGGAPPTARELEHAGR